MASKLLKQGYSSGNVRLIFGMSMVVIQTLITNFTLLCHVYVEGFDHQM